MRNTPHSELSVQTNARTHKHSINPEKKSSASLLPQARGVDKLELESHKSQSRQYGKNKRKKKRQRKKKLRPSHERAQRSARTPLWRNPKQSAFYASTAMPPSLTVGHQRRTVDGETSRDVSRSNHAHRRTHRHPTSTAPTHGEREREQDLRRKAQPFLRTHNACAITRSSCGCEVEQTWFETRILQQLPNQSTKRRKEPTPTPPTHEHTTAPSRPLAHVGSTERE